MQVELAQLELPVASAHPDVDASVAHPRRHRGCGAGRDQLETDRRAIRKKIGRCAADSRTGRSSRQSTSGATPLPRPPGGYTNAGKSASSAPCRATTCLSRPAVRALDTLTREVEVGGGYRFRLTDTVRIIRKLPHHLVASFRATLEEARDADILLHVIDAAHPAWKRRRR